MGLQPFDSRHVERTFLWVSQPALQRAFLLRAPVTRQGNAAHFAAALADPAQRLFAILLAGEHVGNCGLKHIDRAVGTAELWIYLGEAAARGRGVGRRAVARLLQLAAAEGLAGIVVHVESGNTAARRLYAGAGFVEIAGVGAEWAARGIEMIRMVWRGGAA